MSDMLPIKWVERIFLRLSQIYGHVWDKEFNDPINKDLYDKVYWSIELKDLNESQIKMGLEFCKAHQHLEPPYTAEVFKKLCETGSERFEDKSLLNLLSSFGATIVTMQKVEE